MDNSEVVTAIAKNGARILSPENTQALLIVSTGKPIRALPRQLFAE
jgi:hypothetical protein